MTDDAALGDVANELEADDGAVHSFWAYVLIVRARREQPDDYNPHRLDRAADFLRAIEHYEAEQLQ